MVDQSRAAVARDNSGEVLREALDAFAAGDIEAVMSLLADEITFYIPGTSALAGVWAGRERVLEFLATAGELSEGTMTLEPDEVLAAGERVLAVMRVHVRRNGRAETFTNVWAVRVVRGEITELREYMGDERREDEFWGPPQ